MASHATRKRPADHLNHARAAARRHGSHCAKDIYVDDLHIQALNSMDAPVFEQVHMLQM
jgi:hypothetical protein